MNGEQYKELYARAESGQATAEELLSLGIALYEGDEVPQDSEAAFKCFSKADEAGNALAAYYKGVCHYYGQGAPVADGKAYRLFKKAAEGGIEEAKQALETLSFEEHDLSVRAQNGDEEARCLLGEAHKDSYYDVGVSMNAYIHAAEQYEVAAENGNPQALLELAYLYGVGWGVGKDKEKSEKYYCKAYECARERAAADGNDFAAKYWLGKCLCNGYGCRENQAEGMKLINEAADGGYITALFALADSYGEGGLTGKGVARCHEILEKLGECGSGKVKRRVAACYSCGEGYSDSARADYWYERAAEEGEAYSQYRTAEKYYAAACENERAENSTEAKKNYERAVYWYSQAVKSGYIEARYDLGFLYFEGIYVDKDYARAEELLKPLARRTHGGKDCIYQRHAAAAMLGDIYLNGGYGVERDENRAFNWYYSAANRDNKHACAKLGDMYAAGIAVGQDYAAAVEWYERAVFNYDEVVYYGNDEGYDYAANVGLGDCYRYGLGVRQDEEEAFRLYNDVAKYTEDYPLADVRVAECYYFGIGVKKDGEQARGWLEGAAQKGSEEAKSLLKKYFNAD